MPALNFQKQWADEIKVGADLANGWATPPNPCRPKRTTIRRVGKTQPGETLYLYTGQRTKACRKLGEVICLGVTPVVFSEDYSTMWLGPNKLTPGQCEAFARLDTAGLWGWEEFTRFFAQTYGDLQIFELISW